MYPNFLKNGRIQKIQFYSPPPPLYWGRKGKITIFTYKENEINTVRYYNDRTLAFFCGVNNKISLQIETFKEEDCSFSGMVGCIAHEFQHYLDRLSFETPEQWSLAYEKNVNYYEYKANRFASKKQKKLSKMLLKTAFKWKK